MEEYGYPAADNNNKITSLETLYFWYSAPPCLHDLLIDNYFLTTFSNHFMEEYGYPAADITS